MIYGKALESALSSPIMIYIHKPSLDLALKDNSAVSLADISVIFANVHTHIHILIDLWLPFLILLHFRPENLLNEQVLQYNTDFAFTLSYVT